MTGFLLVTVVSVAALAVVQGVAFAVGHRIGRYNTVDVAWGAGIVLVAWIALALGDGDATRGWIVTAIVTVWGLRLSWHMWVKSAGKGEDPRYTEFLQQAGGVGTGTVLRKIFVVQGAAQWFVSLPVQVSAAAGPTTGPWTAVLILGIAFALTGFAFEAVGDHQLRRFTADPDNRGRIIDRGLWAWTRHPNYFGDACLWWGLWLMTASVWPGALTVLSPVIMSFFLVHATGARRLERFMSRRPGWAEYAARTSFFVPRPPRGELR